MHIFFVLNFVSKIFYFTTYSYLCIKPIKNYYWALIYKIKQSKKLKYSATMYFSVSTIVYTALIGGEKINIF